jgi:hypothetical protein
MRVRIGTYWLAGDPSKTEREHSSALITYAPKRVQQEQQGMRWVTPSFFDRNNASWEISFQTTRRFESFAESTAFIMGYMSAHAWSGTVVFCQDLGDGTWQEYNLSGAIIEPPVFVPQGVSLQLRYTVRGETYSAGAVSSTGAILDTALDPLTDTAGNAILEPQI